MIRLLVVVESKVWFLCVRLCRYVFLLIVELVMVLLLCSWILLVCILICGCIGVNVESCSFKVYVIVLLVCRNVMMRLLFIFWFIGCVILLWVVIVFDMF